MLQGGAVAGWISRPKPPPTNSGPPPNKRDDEFQGIFNLPEEKVLDDFMCACQADGELLLSQGKMYVTDNYICFYSLLTGAYKKIIKIEDIIALVKKKTAFVIPNAIEVVTNDSKIFFTSFMKRDKTYDFLVKVYRAKTGRNPENHNPDEDDDDLSSSSSSTPSSYEDPSTLTKEVLSGVTSQPSPAITIEPPSDDGTKGRTPQNKPLPDPGASISSPGSTPTMTTSASNPALSQLSISPPKVSSIASTPHAGPPPRAHTVSVPVLPSGPAPKIMMSPGYFPMDVADLKSGEAVPKRESEAKGRAQLLSSEGSPSNKRRPKSNSLMQADSSNYPVSPLKPQPTQLAQQQSQQPQSSKQSKPQPSQSQPTVNQPNLVQSQIVQSSQSQAQIPATLVQSLPSQPHAPLQQQAAVHSQSQPQVQTGQAPQTHAQLQTTQLVPIQTEPESSDAELDRLVDLEKQSDLQLPPLNTSCKHFQSPKSEPMFDETFNLSIKEFYINFLLESTHNFIQDYHQSIEYTETEIDEWGLSEEKCCKKRELRFRVPIKATLGPKSTRVGQTQYCRLQTNSHLLFTTNSISKDVPYGDAFIVDSKWSIVSSSPNDFHCRLKLTVDVRFLKTVWIKSLIEKNVMENTKEYFGDWIARAKAKEPGIIRARQDRLVKLNLRAKNRLPTITTTDAASPPTSPTAASAPVELKLEAPPTVPAELPKQELQAPSPATLRRTMTPVPATSLPTSSSSTRVSESDSLFSLPFIGPINIRTLVVMALLLFVLFSTLGVKSQISQLNATLERQEEIAAKMELRLSFVQMLTALVSQNVTGNKGFMQEEWVKFNSRSGGGHSRGGGGFIDNMQRWKRQISDLQRDLETSLKFLDRVGDQLGGIGTTPNGEDAEREEDDGEEGNNKEEIDLSVVIDSNLDESVMKPSSPRRTRQRHSRDISTWDWLFESSFWWWFERLALTLGSVFLGIFVQKQFF